MDNIVCIWQYWEYISKKYLELGSKSNFVDIFYFHKIGRRNIFAGLYFYLYHETFFSNSLYFLNVAIFKFWFWNVFSSLFSTLLFRGNVSTIVHWNNTNTLLDISSILAEYCSWQIYLPTWLVETQKSNIFS